MKDSNYVQANFKMDFLAKIYKERLSLLITTNEQLYLPNVHVLHLRPMILEHFSYMMYNNPGRVYFNV